MRHQQNTRVLWKGITLQDKHGGAQTNTLYSKDVEASTTLIECLSIDYYSPNLDHMGREVKSIVERKLQPKVHHQQLKSMMKLFWHSHSIAQPRQV